MEPHFKGAYVDMIRRGVDLICGERYRNWKGRFKQKVFKDREGFEHPQEIRQFPPPHMEQVEWEKYVDFYLDPDNMSRSEVNTVNRSKQKYPSGHGTKSYAARRHEERNKETGEYPSLVDDFFKMHKKDKGYVNKKAKIDHGKMLALKKKQIGSSTPMSEKAILKKILGESRGHCKGRGRKVTSVGSSSSVQSQGSQMSSQKQLEEMLKAQQEQMKSQQQQIESQNEFMTSLCSVLKKAKIPVSKFVPYQPTIVEGENEHEEEGEDEDEDEEKEDEDEEEGEDEDEEEGEDVEEEGEDLDHE